MASKRLVRSSEITRAQAVLGRVFVSDDPFAAPFHHAIGQRAFLYDPVTAIDSGHLAALADAARAVGPRDVFVMLTEDEVGAREAAIWETVLDSDLYRRLESDPRWLPGLEHALVSTDGSWGVLCSHDNHALVGGCPAFMTELGRRIDFARELEELADAIREDLTDPRVDSRGSPS